jgi:SpoVK/Ycf46/Vps4 family AAA+-type ATPase
MGATNEPERLSPAMIRSGRFDDKIAFLIPKKSQRPGIFSALFRKKKILEELRGGEFRWEVTAAELVELAEMLDYYIDLKGQMRSGGPDEPTHTMESQLVPLTGGFIEKVITYGWRLVRRNQEMVLTMKHLTEVVRTTLPGAETRDYRRMNQNALLYVDSIGGIPPEYEKEWREIHGGPDGAR